jgi:hypothetical protein
MRQFKWIEWNLQSEARSVAHATNRLLLSRN